MSGLVAWEFTTLRQSWKLIQVKVNSTDKQPGPAWGSNLTGPVSDVLIDWPWMRSINNFICSVLTNLKNKSFLCFTLWQVYLSEVQHTHCIRGRSTAQLSIRHTWDVDLVPDSLVYCTFHWSGVVEFICACGGYFFGVQLLATLYLLYNLIFYHITTTFSKVKIHSYNFSIFMVRPTYIPPFYQQLYEDEWFLRINYHIYCECLLEVTNFKLFHSFTVLFKLNYFPVLKYKYDKVIK